MTRAAFEPSSDLSRCDSVVALWSCRSVAMTLQEPFSSPGAQSEALVFLIFFGDLPDPRQAGKVIYPLQEVLLLCLLAVLAGPECFVETHGSARRRSNFFEGSCRSRMGPRRTTSSAIFLR